MSVILFIDLLGARKKWQSGGVPEATDAFNHFASMVIAAIRKEQPQSILGGGIETDSAMITFESALAALQTAKRLYLWAFNSREFPDSSRLWLRGSLVANNDQNFLRRESHLNPPVESVSIFTYSPPALSAISVEKSGFKGMRLLVSADAIDSKTRDSLRIPFDQYSFIPLRKLRHSSYPKVIDGEYLDFLWMASGDDDESFDLSLHMTSRLRHAAKDPDEFAQAAATQVVFHESSAIRQSIVSRAKRARAMKQPKQ